MRRLRYIAFEGADGTGKTTLSQALADRLNAFWTYEPNGEGQINRNLRSYCLDPIHKEAMNWRAREYLLLATRALSTLKVKNALDKCQTVITDRSIVSGMVYANVASGMSFFDWWRIAGKAFWVKPDIIVNVVTDKQKIVGDSIYDTESDDFHSRIQQAFPKALSFFRQELLISSFTFENNFNLLPEENLKDLLTELSSWGPL